MGTNPSERAFIRCDWQYDVREDLKRECAHIVEVHASHGPGNMADCDTFLCVPQCGNDTRGNGFFPCDATGNEAEPELGKWQKRYGVWQMRTHHRPTDRRSLRRKA